MNRLTALTTGLLIACSALITTPVLAHDYSQGDVKIDHPWSRPTPPGTPMGVGYLSISNTGGSDIVLVSVRTPRAERVSIHRSSMQDGVMRMTPVKGGLAIPAGATVELEPHSYHLMLEKLKSPLQEGEAIPVTLSFKGAEDMDVELNVAPLDAPAVKSKDMDHSGAGMDHSGS
ncbi:copper chaperone PCu(A)C [Marinobacter sp.]|uniref:copper chaperone PCu(A)C n=1 Tax=Marinobacter sp. TaxID=50741 RepID=UPI003A90DA97